MTVLLDSHTVLWWIAESRFLSRRARTTIDAARRRFISPISCWEIALLAERGKVRLSVDTYEWVQSLFGLDGVELAPLTSSAAVAAALLPAGEFPGDPADRLLYATALDLGVPFLTRDRALHAYARVAGDVRVIW